MTEEGRKHSDAEGLQEVLDVVADRIPNLLRSIREALYSKEAATDVAEAVGTIYTKLIEAGVPKDDALEMARGYMINLKDWARGFAEGWATGLSSAKDIKQELKKAIAEEEI